MNCTITTGCILATVHNNRRVTGSTERITTNITVGWCGVDLVERVTFELNTVGTLRVNVEGRVYRLRGVRKSELFDVLRRFLRQNRREMDAYLIKEA